MPSGSPKTDVPADWLRDDLGAWGRPDFPTAIVGATLGGSPSDGNHIGLPPQQKDNEGF